MRRTKYAKYWYYPIIVMLQNYDLLDKDENATLSIQFKKAIDDTIEEFSKTKEGREAVKAINLIDIKRTHTIDGAVLEMFLSKNTIKRRRKKFIYSVGEKMHFM